MELCWVVSLFDIGVLLCCCNRINLEMHFLLLTSQRNMAPIINCCLFLRCGENKVIKQGGGKGAKEGQGMQNNNNNNLNASQTSSIAISKFLCS